MHTHTHTLTHVNVHIEFGGQEPDAAPQVCAFVKDRFKTTFPILDKVDVNGKDAAPVFNYLKKEQGGFLTNAVKCRFVLVFVGGWVIRWVGGLTQWMGLFEGGVTYSQSTNTTKYTREFHQVADQGRQAHQALRVHG